MNSTHAVPMAHADARAILNHYRIGTVKALSAAGGTAGKTWRVRATGGKFFLRLRGLRTSASARVRFDRRLRTCLVKHDIPTIPPLPTKGNRFWVKRAGRVFELYPYISAHPFDCKIPAALLGTAEALAKFHRATRNLASAAIEPVAQYTLLGFSRRTSTRLDDPKLLMVNMQGVRQLAPSAANRGLIDRCLIRARALKESYAGKAYKELCGWLVHGDFTPANLLYTKKGSVRGLFDFDWSFPGARCRDIADALYFFCRKKTATGSSGIWTLAQAVDMDSVKCLAFLKAYHRLSPICPNELQAIPSAFAARWFSIRLEGMAKVSPAERFDFFSRGILRPLVWFDRNWSSIRKHFPSTGKQGDA